MTDAQIRQKFPSLTDKPLVEAGFLCRHGFHRMRRWGDDFDQLAACKKCGLVNTVHIFYGMTSDYPIYTFVGYANPEEVVR